MKKRIAMFIISAAITSCIGMSLPGNIVFAVQEGISENEENNPVDIPEDNGQAVGHSGNPAEDKEGDSVKEPSEGEELTSHGSETEENNGTLSVDDPADIPENNGEDNEHQDNAVKDKEETSVKEPSKDEEPVLQGAEIEKNNGTLPVDEFHRNKEKLFGDGIDDEKQKSMQNEESDPEKETEKTNSEKEDRASLQIPESLDIVIDPFEINGRGQIYSKEYCIKNTGKTAGLLKITNFMCTPGEKSGVIITNDSNGMHDANEKLVCMEIVFANGYTITFPSEETEYEVRLEPDEELRFFYSGEVNENALQGWKEHDLMVGMVYFWNIEKETPENEVDSKEEEMSLDLEIEENTTEEDYQRSTWVNNDMSDIFESKEPEEMKQSKISSSGENVDKENVNGEEQSEFDDKDFQESQSDLTDGNKQ